MPDTRPKPFVIDASALLALLQAETGADLVEDALADGSISAANLSEVAAKLVQHGVPAPEMTALLQSFDLDVIPVDETIALEAGRLYTAGKEYGLSLGDRLCLATGIVFARPVLTADQAWGKLSESGLEVTLLR